MGLEYVRIGNTTFDGLLDEVAIYRRALSPSEVQEHSAQGPAVKIDDATPWSYNATFQATQAIIGYFDSEFLEPGGAGPQRRYAYKGLFENAGGHFWASSRTGPADEDLNMNTTPMHGIDGLCTPCHDPHGVSPTAIGECNQPSYVTRADCLAAEGSWTPTPEYGVPMLKGTWLTSPYKEDAAPTETTLFAGRNNQRKITSNPGYHIDQNTFADWDYNYGSGAGEGITENPNVFAGLCLRCHQKAAIDPDADSSWGSMDRVHETVKDWGAGNQHEFSCSKCHTPHNGSALPRLMVTNCLDFRHRGRVGADGYPNQSSYNGSNGGGRGGFPGGGSGSGGCVGCEFGPVSYNYGFGGNFANGGIACHDNVGNGSWPENQLWNQVTPWTSPPYITATPEAFINSGLTVLLHMDEGAWEGTPDEVYDSSGNTNHGRAYSGVDTVTGGICDRAGSFDGTSDYVKFDYTAGTPANDFTISAWIKPAATHQLDAQSTSGTGGYTGQHYVFWSDYISPPDAGVSLSAGTNGISVYEYSSGYMPALAQYNDTISSTEWTHVVVVYSDKRPSIYVNGVLVKTGLASPRTTVYAPTSIGGGPYGYFSGGIDEMAVFDRALRGDEVEALYQYQQTCPTVPVPVTAAIQWSTEVNADSCVDYGPTDSYGFTECDSSQVKSHGLLLTGLANNTTYHYRVRSSNAEGEQISDDYTFDIAVPPTVPIQNDEPDAICSSPCSVDLDWSASVDPDADPVEYWVTVDDDADFGSPFDSDWITGTSWTSPSLPASTRYYWKVKSRNQVYPASESDWSTSDTFLVASALPPASPVQVPEPDIDASFPQTITLEWSAVTAPDADPVQYYVEVDNNPDFSSPYKWSGWISATAWAFTHSSTTTWYWRVRARDSVHTDGLSAWSATDYFATKDSCPFIFVWNGSEYVYVTDIQGPVIGLPAVTPAARSVGLFQPAAVVLDNLEPDNGGYRIKLRETLKEITYLDEVKLQIVDYPEGYQLASSSAENTYSYGYVNPRKIYTLKDPRPPLSAFSTSGNDILASVSAVDNQYAPLDYNAPEYITLDFGTIIDPGNTKLVIEGWTVYSASLRTGEPVQPHVEVLDSAGNWTGVASFGEPAGDLKRMVVPLGEVFQNSDQRIRLHLGKKSGGRWRLDRVMLDESAPVPLTVREVAAVYGDLYHSGMVPHSASSLESRILAEDGSLPDHPAAYGYGGFTRYGDVLPLLAAADDKFVIMRHGDAVELEFPAAEPAAPGMERGYLLQVDLYYKSFRVENNVEPLPFHGMSIYPPAAGEGYPDDPEHRQYLRDYNTREYAAPGP